MNIEEMTYIEKMICFALNTIPPSFATSCLMNKYFIVPLRNEEGIFVFIDTQKKITSDENEFVGHTYYLIDCFKNIKKWYEC